MQEITCNSGAGGAVGRGVIAASQGLGLFPQAGTMKEGAVWELWSHGADAATGRFATVSQSWDLGQFRRSLGLTLESPLFFFFFGEVGIRD